MNELTVSVKGMTCNHCKATVEENIGKLPGIKSVSADIVSGKVKLTGNKFDLDQIRFKVESIGYNWGGVVKKDRI
jgi:hypothetical protein